MDNRFKGVIILVGTLIYGYLNSLFNPGDIQSTYNFIKAVIVKSLIVLIAALAITLIVEVFRKTANKGYRHEFFLYNYFVIWIIVVSLMSWWML